MKQEARASHGELIQRLKSVERERLLLEKQHADDMLTLEADKTKKEGFLKGKIETLGKQVRTLRASSSRGRAMLYWTSMNEARSKAAARADLAELGGDEDDDDETWRIGVTSHLGGGGVSTTV